MATSSGVFEAMYQYYMTLAERGMSVMRSVREDVLKEQFDYKRFMAQALGLWLDASGGWWSALQLSSAPRLAGIFIGIPAGQVGKGTLMIQVPREGELAVTPLTSIDGKKLREVQVRSGAQREELVATATPPAATPPGVYQGWVYAGEQMLALLVVKVTEAVPAAKAGKTRRFAPQRPR
jgi:hypothetical protein